MVFSGLPALLHFNISHFYNFTTYITNKHSPALQPIPIRNCEKMDLAALPNHLILSIAAALLYLSHRDSSLYFLG